MHNKRKMFCDTVDSQFSSIYVYKTYLVNHKIMYKNLGNNLGNYFCESQ